MEGAERLDCIVEVFRGDVIESVHRINACVCDARGTILRCSGNIAEPVYLRSATKPFIAAAVVHSGAADRFRFTDREIAIIAGSHTGQPFHTQTVEGMLAKIGLTETALRCGPSPPADEKAARTLLLAGEPFRAIHNNCSGKHAGILAMALYLSADVETYLDLSHPAQRAVNRMYYSAFDVTEEDVHFGVDGCGIPAIALPLSHAAVGFARLASPDEFAHKDARALKRVQTAMARYPEYVRGTGHLDTELMRTSHGAIVAKGGAEGVFAVGVSSTGLGLAVKVADGTHRAVAPAVTTYLRELNALPDGFKRFLVPPIVNSIGQMVGEIRAQMLPIVGRSH